MTCDVYIVASRRQGGVEGMARQYFQCHRSDYRSRRTGACKEKVSSAILVGRMDYYRLSGKPVLDLESTQVRLDRRENFSLHR